jgi:hypothetical protein
MNEEIIQKFTKFREDLSTYILNSFTNKEAIIDPVSNTIRTVDKLIETEIENNKKIISGETKNVINTKKDTIPINITNLIYQLNTVINKQCISLSYVADYGSYKEYKITEHFKGIVPKTEAPATAPSATAPATAATALAAAPAAAAPPATAEKDGGTLISSVKSFRKSLSARKEAKKAARKAAEENKFQIYDPVTANASTIIVLGMFALEEKLNEYADDIKNLLEDFVRELKNLFLDYAKNQKTYVSIFTLKELTVPIYKDLFKHESATIKTATIDHIIYTLLSNSFYTLYFDFKDYFNAKIEKHLYKIIDKSNGTNNINENLKLLIKMIYIESFILIGYIKIKPISGGDSARYAFSRNFNTKQKIGGGGHWMPTISELETAAIKMFLVATTLERCIPDSDKDDFKNIRGTFYKDIDNIYSECIIQTQLMHNTRYSS